MKIIALFLALLLIVMLPFSVWLVIRNVSLDDNKVIGTIEHSHTPGTWVVDKKPTCTAAGSRHQACDVCGETVKTEIVSATGHDFVNNTCTVCKIKASQGLEFTYNGNGSCYVSSVGTCQDTDIVIPTRSPNGDRVTGIGQEAFSRCLLLTSVDIPNSVTSIGRLAFFNCNGLKNFIIGNGVTSIGDYAFNSCLSLKSVTISNSVKSIGREAFENCVSLTSISYQGTKLQWTAVKKGYNWNYCTGQYTIYCTDGNIAE